MRIQQPGAARNPISVDAQLFSGLKSTLAGVEAIGISRVANLHTVSTETVQWIATSAAESARVAGAAVQAPPAIVASELQAIGDNRVAKIRKDIRRYTSPKFVLSHESEAGVVKRVAPSFTKPGKSFEPENLDRLISLLETEAGNPSSIRIEVGERSNFSLQLVIGGVSSAALYEISGEQNDCAVVAARVENMFLASAPEHPWLHRWWGQQLVALACALCVGAAFAAIFTLFAEGLWYVITVGGAAVSYFPFRWIIRQAYPVCQFDLGPAKRKRATYEAVVRLSLLLMVVPMARAAIVR